MTPEKRHQFEWYAGAVVFIAFIAAHLMFGAKAAVKVLGVACVATGLLWMVRRSVPVGIEGWAPSFYLGGWGAILAGLAMLAVGVVLLTYTAVAVCLLGWGSAAECP
jgi:maltodextrin utilization protein YvdJ